MNHLLYLNKYLVKYAKLLCLGILFIIISNGFQITPAIFVRYAINLIAENNRFFQLFSASALDQDFSSIVIMGVLICVLAIITSALLRGFFLFLVRQTIIAMSRYIEYDLKNEIYLHFQFLPLSFYKKNNTGDLMARISEDVSKVRMYLGPAIMYGLNMLFLFGMVVPYIFSINTRLTLYALAPLPILSITIYVVSRMINKRSEIIQNKLSALSTFVQEAFSGIRVIKAYNREKESVADFLVESNDYKAKSLNLTFIDAIFFPAIMAMIGLSTILTIYIGGLEVYKGNITYGNIAEFILYVNMLTWPVTALGWITSIIQRAEASQARLNELLHEDNELVSQHGMKPKIKGAITFDKVSFTYPETGIQALEDVSFSVKPGETLAIIGTTGSGKSTIANLIARCFLPSKGTINIDNHNIHDIDSTYLRSKIGYVPQEVFLFSTSILNNIAFGDDKEHTRQEIEEAAKKAALYDNVIALEHGFDTVLGERGVTLSGGQKQRTSIARALVRTPEILILDDSLSAVDTKTEKTILQNLKDVMTDRTSIIISHRVSSAKLADYVIVLDDGKIIEQGTNDYLMAQDGVYKNLYDMQLTETTL